MASSEVKVHSGRDIAVDILGRIKPYIDMTGVSENETNGDRHKITIQSLDEAFINCTQAILEIPATMANYYNGVLTIGSEAISPISGMAFSAFKTFAYGAMLGISVPVGVGMFVFGRIQRKFGGNNKAN